MQISSACTDYYTQNLTTMEMVHVSGHYTNKVIESPFGAPQYVK